MNNIFVVFVFIIFVSIFAVVVGEVFMLIWFLILAVVLIAALVYRNNLLTKSLSKVPEKELHVLNLDKGGIFKLTGVGDNSDEINLKVLAKHLYRQGEYYWYELECDKGDGEKVWVEIEDDDETIVSVVLEKLTLNNRDLNLTPAKLDIIDETESGTLQYKNANFVYTDSDKATFYKFCDDSRAEKFYYWDFESGTRSISVERWGDSEYRVYYCQKMKPSQITVYLNEKGGNKR